MDPAWCLVVDQDNTLLGSPFEILAKNIAGVKEQVKEKKYITLKDVEADRLIIWRLKKPMVSPDADDHEIQELLDTIPFPDRTMAEKLPSGKTLASLGLSDKETLLVQVPRPQIPDPATRTNIRKPREVEESERSTSRRGAETGVASSFLPNDMILDHLEKFRQDCWGSVLNPALTTPPPHIGDLSGFDLGTEGDDVLPDNPFLQGLNHRFLVRAEYIRTFDSVKALRDKYNGERMAVVTGQPGIGKTTWISYAIRRCLGEKQSVLYYQGGVLYLLSEERVRSVRSWTPYTWCFVHSIDVEGQFPHAILNCLNQLFPIYVTYPEKQRWAKLEQIRRYKLIVMNPWTRGELEKAAIELYPEQTAEEISKRFDDMGPTPRFCLDYGPSEIRLFHTDRAAIRIDTPNMLKLTFLDENHRWQIDYRSHLLFLMRRSEALANFTVGPISPVARRILLTRLWGWEAQARTNMIERLRTIPDTVGISALLLESRCQRGFANSMRINTERMTRVNDSHCHWNATYGEMSAAHQSPTDHGRDPSTKLNASLPPRINISPSWSRTYSRGETIEIKDDIYYVPLGEDEVAIDSFVVHAGRLHMFRFYGGSSSVANHSCRTALGRCSNLPEKQDHRLIFFVPKDLTEFNYSLPKDGFLQDLVPLIARIDM